MSYRTYAKEVNYLKPECSFEDCFFGSATVGERGQVVIPSEARKRLSIQPGDKLLVMAHPNNNGLVMFKIEEMREFLSGLLEGISRVEEELLIPGAATPDK